MPQADIEINGTNASDEDLPIDTLVQFSNNDVGDETTYDWEIVSQPAGAPDALSALQIENPTLTPLKEDAYLVQLTVDIGLPSEVVDRKLFRIRRLKTNNALVAAEESIEADSDEGYKTTQNATLADHDNRLVTGTVLCGVAGGTLSIGDIVKVTEIATIKSGLPGEEVLPEFGDALATNADVTGIPLAMVIGAPDGSGGVVITDVVLVRFLGLYLEATFTGVPGDIGDPVYVSDTGVPSLSVGSNTRQIGVVANFGAGEYTVFFNGLAQPV